MKHFNKITSIEVLKEQYRKLAIENHPDKGGKTEVMQEINQEYFILFPIWKNISKDISKDTAESTQKEFYIENGWVGENYNINLWMTDISKIVREYVKQKYPTYKFSIRADNGNSLDISLMEAPEDVFIHEKLEAYEKSDLYIQVNQFYIENDHRITELCRAILNDIIDFAQTYNFDKSDRSQEIYHCNFHYHLTVGKYNKPFKINQKKARIENKKSNRTTTSENQPDNLQIVANASNPNSLSN